MSFEWHRMHKHEEQIENDVYDRVMTQILEHYEIEDLSELTENNGKIFINGRKKT